MELGDGTDTAENDRWLKPYQQKRFDEVTVIAQKPGSFKSDVAADTRVESSSVINLDQQLELGDGYRF